MSFFMMKSILSIFFLLAGSIAVICMLNLLGKKERKVSDKFLRSLHKGMGYVFALLLVVISILCLKYWASAGDQISIRAVIHGVLAFAVIIVFVLKLLIVRYYKQFLRFAPPMGLTVFALSFIVFMTSAGFFFLRTLVAQSEPSEISIPSAAIPLGNAENGGALFISKCSPCHYADREDVKHGPGLKNILKRDTLPTSNRPATVENISLQLRKPYRVMPSFTSLSNQELADLLAYLKTL